jgi:hypothetical protein
MDKSCITTSFPPFDPFFELLNLAENGFEKDDDDDDENPLDDTDDRPLSSNSLSQSSCSCPFFLGGLPRFLLGFGRLCFGLMIGVRHDEEEKDEHDEEKGEVKED